MGWQLMYEPHTCAVPDSKYHPVGTITLCDCGQCWQLVRLLTMEYWGRITKDQAEAAMKQGEARPRATNEG